MDSTSPLGLTQGRKVIIPRMEIPIVEELRKEWPVIRQAPILFFTALAILSAAMWGILYVIFNENLTRKNDLIKTLQEQLASYPAQAPPRAPFENSARPSFRLLLQGANIFIPDTEPNLTGIALDVIITNTGAPSVALDWSLSVVPSTGSPKAAQLTKMPKSLVARGPSNTAYINSSESLEESTLTDSLETNIPRSGKLLFYIALPKQAVMDSVLELSVTDVKGNHFLVRQKTSEWLHR
jgi:hypothetical protein